MGAAGLLSTSTTSAGCSRWCSQQGHSLAGTGTHRARTSACRPVALPWRQQRGWGNSTVCAARRGKAKQPGQFEVLSVTPPPQSLGVHALPPNTHNGEQIEIEGEGYVVTSLVLQYKLVKGKYVREHNRLEVQPTSRYFLNLMLDSLVNAKPSGPTGKQD